MGYVVGAGQPPNGLTMFVGISLALAVGVATGLRTFAALAVLRYAYRDWTSVLAGLALVGELIADLIPNVPSRTSFGPLIGRCIFGGYCAAVVGAMHGLPPWAGALCGVIGAVAGAFAGLNWRVRVAPSIKLHPVIAALLEDALAVGGAIALIG
jgi:uncharacterized membrane protein